MQYFHVSRKIITVFTFVHVSDKGGNLFYISYMYLVYLVIINMYYNLLVNQGVHYSLVCFCKLLFHWRPFASYTCRLHVSLDTYIVKSTCTNISCYTYMSKTMHHKCTSSKKNHIHTQIQTKIYVTTTKCSATIQK